MNRIWQTDFVVAQTACLARSLNYWTGREMLPADPAEAASAESPAFAIRWDSRKKFLKRRLLSYRTARRRTRF